MTKPFFSTLGKGVSNKLAGNHSATYYLKIKDLSKAAFLLR